MRTAATIGAFVIALMVGQAPAIADPGRDESRGRERAERWRAEGNARQFRRERERRYVIPRGHLPPPGECRVWNPRRPAGHQPPPYRC